MTRSIPSMTRRRLILGAMTLPLATAVLTLGISQHARAATGTIPLPVLDLDRAAMALFDAAEDGHWDRARQSLDRARAAANALTAVEAAYSDDGGHLGHFYAARNNLSADLIEAKTAISVKDRRWLVSSADRIAARAGELSQTFVGADDSLTPRIETLLFLARRMRRALVWQDNTGFSSARHDFRNLWQMTRTDLKTLPTERLHALDEALAKNAGRTSQANARLLYEAVLALRNGLH